MGNQIDCCYATRQYNQCVFPCIRCCSYTDKRLFYNFDGMEVVQPLVLYYVPRKGSIHEVPEALETMKHDDEEFRKQLEQGLSPPDQLAAICRYASKNGYKVRAVGTGSSWSPLTSTRDILVDMTSLNRILTPKPKRRTDNMTKEFVDIEVEGGVKVHKFVELLDQHYGLGLDMIGNYAGQTVAGVASTSTHGSSYFRGTLSTLVVGMHLITSDGVQVKIREGTETIQQCQEKYNRAEYGGPAVVMESTDVLRAVAVGLGSLGIIYSITYRCVPSYNIEEVRKIVKVPWIDGQSFNITAEFENVYQDMEGEYFSFFVNPYPQPGRFLYVCYLKGKRTDRRSTCCSCCSWWCGPGGRGISECWCLQSDCSGSCLQTCAACCPESIPGITNCGLSQFYNPNPYVQRWYNVLQFTKGNLHVRTAEWCLPLSHLDAALGDVIKTANKYAKNHKQYSLLPIYVRLVKADNLYISPANQKRPGGSGTCEQYCYIEVPFLPGAFGIDEYHQLIEEMLVSKYQARPHWGKNNSLQSTSVQRLYPDLFQWEKVFKMFNRSGTFCNEFTCNVGFDSILRSSELNQHGVIEVQPS